MGLLDGFNDPQTQGLLAAAGGFFQAGAPSRTPVGFGQALTAGLQGYTTSIDAQRKRQLDEEREKQLAQLRALEIKSQTGTLEQQQIARTMLANINKEKMSLGALPAVGAPGAQPATSTTSATPGPNSPMIQSPAAPDWMQAYQAQQRGDQAPANQFATSAAPAGLAAPRAAQRNLTQEYAERLLKEAEIHSRNGDFDGADKRYQAAAKYLPEVNKVEPGRDPQTGKLVNVITYKDGTQKVSEFGVKPDFHPVDQGGTVTIQDYNQLTPGQRFTKTATPGEMMSASTARARLAFDQGQAALNNAAPQYMDTSAGIVALPKKLANGVAPVGTVVTGPDGKPLEKRRETPQYVVEGITGNAKSLSSIDNALASLNAKGGQNGVGYKAYLPPSILNRYDPDGTSVRADIADIGSLVLHERSGAAVTAAESPRLMPFIPQATDDAETVKKKLTRMKQLIQAENNNLTFQYPQAKALANYATGGAGGQHDPGAPVAPPASKKISLSDIAVTAKKSGRSTAEVTAAARAAGYVIGGE